MNNATTTALDYWKKQPASIYGMMLNPEAEDLHRQEREQIIDFLPDFSGKKNLELGAGIGRFTNHFAAQANWVTAVDFNTTFSSYYEFAKDDIDVVYYQLKKENNFTLDIDKYLRVIEQEAPDTVVLINPNNPDGSYIQLADLDYLLGQLKDIKNIVIDESFIHFASEGDYQINSSVKLLSKYNNLIVIKSMSKDFGIAGIRAGYGVMSADKVEYLLKNGYLWNLSGFSEYFFRVFVRDEFQKELRPELRQKMRP